MVALCIAARRRCRSGDDRVHRTSMAKTEGSLRFVARTCAGVVGGRPKSVGWPIAYEAAPRSWSARARAPRVGASARRRPCSTPARARTSSPATSNERGRRRDRRADPVRGRSRRALRRRRRRRASRCEALVDACVERFGYGGRAAEQRRRGRPRRRRRTDRGGVGHERTRSTRAASSSPSSTCSRTWCARDAVRSSTSRRSASIRWTGLLLSRLRHLEGRRQPADAVRRARVRGAGHPLQCRPARPDGHATRRDRRSPPPMGATSTRRARQRNARCPTGKMGDAWDVAHASLYLASDESSYVNGHLLVVDGGLSCAIP